MELTILGSGGCTVIPKPLCRCRICEEARSKGVPYERSGPAAFIHDENILIDTPAEICRQLNRARIERIDTILLTHLDPDHVEGLRVVEQIALDFRSWQGYPDKQLQIRLPDALQEGLPAIRCAYGPLIDFYEKQGFVRCSPFGEKTRIGRMTVTGVPVQRGSALSFIYALEADGEKVVYAPCDIKPFPEDKEEVRDADLLVIQPGIFEEGLRHGFVYPRDHISRSTLYTFEQTLALGRRIGAKGILFVHLEEYWNRGYDDYLAIQGSHENIAFAYDNMHITI